ncbi:MAG: tRNA (adenosine(37)-N6)-threonylcarbamoyltransferase complex dimerization subunit type 1 TsaB [Pseudomonadales bacterium]|jgi:tRNA threonylcarbamoyladenosine biosynthesis protein TsaB|nr:tRNA (adenosine(37)-N6)-threonylcarbamoyltransferase complex dimerization subunit type 1 TsaB [Pseudomonadales bacterium]MDP6471689.1 tRNA (adenosine(37)-N6)-threonylcarbamoyltransferase complex dimerization subunit type 1 TsaB [Pseudomonadales bacterium]MDP6972203.1 tRNA (adenosine(37)-N6)-threonylcarbamoyltransferase complex dimerization subunit type 1 TsaB [Pseudomonadales bacterium]|tara:strand:- start:282 stop:965 length:684 start_codon:yes stop_codon:yes gene_type:complete
MSLILGIETSQSLCSAARCSDGVIVAEDTHPLQRLHNEHVLTSVDEVMSGVQPETLDAVGFGCGPGSFTGVRIAASVAQAIAYGAEACILPVSSTRLLAEATWQRGESGGVVTVIPSRRDAYYVAAFVCEADESRVRILDDVLWEGVEPWRRLQASLPSGSWLLAGVAPPWIDDIDPCVEVLDGVQVTGAHVARMAALQFENGKGLDPADGLPVYVTGDSPWRPSGE